jgi:hypothetical protein
LRRLVLKEKDPNDDIKGRCERTEERLKATKLRLREVSAEFKQAVGRKSPSRSGDAAKLAELLSLEPSRPGRDVAARACASF